MPQKRISIVVPVYNSADFLTETLQAIDAERKKNRWRLELIMVDDGSADDSFEVLRKLRKKYSYLKAVKLSRNFGHQAAVKTGLERCTGDYVAIIDDDLQDPPTLLPEFFSYLDQGYDVAYGVRRKRKENFFKVAAYSLFYKVLRTVSETYMPLDSGDFCVMTKRVVENMLRLNEAQPFLRGIRSWVGFEQIGIEYERNERLAGESGYTLRKLFRIAFDGIFSFSNLPLRLTTLLGSFGLAFAILYATYVLYGYFAHGISAKGFPTLALLIMLFGSVNLICLGIIGEYIARIYNEGKNRPLVIVAEELGKGKK